MSYFTASTYTVASGNIVYASDLNTPISGLETAFNAIVSDIRTGDGLKVGPDTGAADAYALNLDPAITSYEDGLEIWLKPANTNTGASTLDVNGLGAISIRRFGLQVLEAGDLQANYYSHLKYSGGYFQIVSVAGSVSAAAAAYATAAGVSATAAASSKTDAETAQAAAEAAAAGLDIEAITAGMAGKPLVVNAAEDSHEHGQALDRVQLIDATGSSSVTLDGEDYSTFFIYDMDQNLTIDVDLVDGRKIDLYLYRPGAYTITWDFGTTATYAPSGTITIPSPAAIGKYTIFQPNSYYTFVDYVIAFQSV